MSETWRITDTMDESGIVKIEGTFNGIGVTALFHNGNRGGAADGSTMTLVCELDGHRTYQSFHSDARLAGRDGCAGRLRQALVGYIKPYEDC